MIYVYFGLGLLVIGIGVILASAPRKTSDGNTKTRSETSAGASVSAQSLDHHLDLLAKNGLSLRPDIARADLAQEVGDTPDLDSVLAVMASDILVDDAWPVPCDRAFMLDMECIDHPDAYAVLLRNLHRLTGDAPPLRDVQSQVDFDQGVATLSYACGQTRRSLSPEFQDDWADPEVVDQILNDLQTHLPKGQSFWLMDNGQAFGIYVLTDAHAAGINAQHPGLLLPRGPFEQAL